MCQIWYPLYQSPDIGENSDGDISDFSQSLIKESCRNSITIDDIDMKLGPVTKLYKSNKTTSELIDDDIMLENCDVIVVFWICGQFGAIWKLCSKLIACKT